MQLDHGINGLNWPFQYIYALENNIWYHNQYSCWQNFVLLLKEHFLYIIVYFPKPLFYWNVEDKRASFLRIRALDWMSVFTLYYFQGFCLFLLVLKTIIVGAVTLTNQVCCFKPDWGHWRGAIEEAPLKLDSPSSIVWMTPPNLLTICRLPEWQCGSVQWFVPWVGHYLFHCYRQQLCYNCAWIQDTGICWIQGGIFSIRAQWNTFSASRVALRTTAKGAPAV